MTPHKDHATDIGLRVSKSSDPDRIWLIPAAGLLCLQAGFILLAAMDRAGTISVW